MKRSTHSSRSKRLAIGIVAAALAFSAAPAFAQNTMTAATGPQLDLGASAFPAPPLHLDSNTGPICGVQGRLSIPANKVSILYTRNWAHAYFVDWTLMADTTSTQPAVGLLTVATQQTDSAHTTYWLGVANYTTTVQVVEARFCVLH